jgi:hypothetical protein
LEAAGARNAGQHHRRIPEESGRVETEQFFLAQATQARYTSGCQGGY